MRRLLALVPAAMLVLTLAPPAQADLYHSMTLNCTNKPDNVGQVTATVTWDAGGPVTGGHNDIHLLHRVVVDSSCVENWMRVRIQGTAGRLTFVVGPGAVRTLGRQALEHLGLWQMPFTWWVLKLTAGGRQFGPPPCLPQGQPVSGYWINPDGKIANIPPC